MWDPWLTNSVSTVCLLLPLKCLIVKDRVRPRWVVAFIFAAWVTIIAPPPPPDPSPPSPPALLPLVTCGSVLIHSAGHHGEFPGASQLLVGRARNPRGGHGRSVSGNERRPSTHNEAAGRASMSRVARLWAGPLLTRPDPSSRGCGHGCAVKREANGMTSRPKSKTTNAHECLRMLFLSYPSPPSLSPPPRHHPPKPPTHPRCLRVWDHASLAMGRREGPRYMSHLHPHPSTPPPAPPPPTTCFVTVKCCQSVVFWFFLAPCWVVRKLPAVERTTGTLVR